MDSVVGKLVLCLADMLEQAPQAGTGPESHWLSLSEKAEPGEANCVASRVL